MKTRNESSVAECATKLQTYGIDGNCNPHEIRESGVNKGCFDIAWYEAYFSHKLSSNCYIFSKQNIPVNIQKGSIGQIHCITLPLSFH